MIAWAISPFASVNAFAASLSFFPDFSATNLTSNLQEYKTFVEKMASDKGYSLDFDYQVQDYTVDFNMILTSERMTLKADFTVDRP